MAVGRVGLRHEALALRMEGKDRPSPRRRSGGGEVEAGFAGGPRGGGGRARPKPVRLGPAGGAGRGGRRGSGGSTRSAGEPRAWGRAAVCQSRKESNVRRRAGESRRGGLAG